jgi:glycosyltransferase involved in cell wall biosynthesis
MAMKRPVKVLFLIDTLDGYGAEKSLVEVALKLQEVVPVFVHLFPGKKLKPKLVDSGIKVYSLDIASRKKYKEALLPLKRILEVEKIDIIHSTLFRADVVARKLKKEYPEVLLVGSFVSKSYSKMRYAQLSLLSKLKLFSTQLIDAYTATRVDFYISNSENIVKSNRRALGVPEKKIKVIKNGRFFDPPVFSQDSLENLRKSLKIENKKVFINVARLQKSKGQLDLLDAFNHFVKIHPKAILLLVGEGNLRPAIQKHIQQLKLTGKVKLLGYRDDVSTLLEVSDYFVFPSYYEGMSGALIEAIIAKKPVVASNIGENKECFPEGGALFFEVGNIDSLMQCMLKSIEMENWDQVTEKTYEFGKENFDIDIISGKYENFYKDIADKIN